MERVTCIPEGFGSGERKAGRLIYRHRRGRWGVVAFDTPGGEIREAFFLEDLSIQRAKR